MKPLIVLIALLAGGGYACKSADPNYVPSTNGLGPTEHSVVIKFNGYPVVQPLNRPGNNFMGR